jgi:DNA mismatch repair protein MutL
MEIKFDDDNNIYKFVKAVIQKSIGQYDLVPKVIFGNENEISSKLKQENNEYLKKNDFSDRPANNLNYSKYKERKIYKDEEIDLLFDNINPKVKQEITKNNLRHPFEEDEEDSSNVMHEKSDKENTSFLISLHNKYILSQIKSGLMVIDQHVAHERILYEKALNSFDADIPFSQQLLFAEEVKLEPADYELLKLLEPYLQRLGFEILFKKKNTIIINGVPSDVKSGTEVDTLRGILEEYRINEEEKHLEERDNLAKSFSCKTAIKAGDRLSEQEMRVLVDQLFATSMPYVCPHGRPIIIKIPLAEFDKRFGRI